ncbi:type II secretion system protein GspG [Stenotrophomonas daejeonensis]
MMPPRRYFPKSMSTQRGMSLLEIIIVLVLIGGVLVVVGSRVLGGADKGKFKLTEAQVQTLAGKIESYQLDTHVLPASLGDLVAKPAGVSGWLGPYAKASDLKDPWGRDLEYRAPGQDGAPFDLVSYGADGKPGGDSYRADIKYE